MYTTYLKVKVLSLTAEAQIIKAQERKFKRKAAKTNANNTNCRDILFGLANHRKYDVRQEQRSSLLAYAFLRGRTFEQIEGKAKSKPDLKRVANLVSKYGGPKDATKDVTEWYEKFAPPKAS